MNKKLISLFAICSAVGIYAAQDASLTIRQVRDPVQLQAKLNANATDAESRLVAAGAVATSAIVLTNSANAGTCYIDAKVDALGDAGDYVRLLFPDGGGLTVQTDQASAGTLATVFAVGNTGIATLKGGATLDNTASATELNITETAVKVTGNFTVTGTTTLTTPLAITQVATNTIGAKVITFTSPTCTNVLYFSAQGILTNAVLDPAP
jgi:hypothetical protein